MIGWLMSGSNCRPETDAVRAGVVEHRLEGPVAIEIVGVADGGRVGAAERRHAMPPALQLLVHPRERAAQHVLRVLGQQIREAERAAPLRCSTAARIRAARRSGRTRSTRTPSVTVNRDVGFQVSWT